MKFSTGALRLDAFSTISSIFDTVDSSNILVTLILITPERLMHPLITSSPASTSFGSASPVSDEVSTEEFPSITVPSSGIFSPGLTSTVSPMLTSYGSTVSSLPSFKTTAKSGLISISAATDFLDLSTA